MEINSIHDLILWTQKYHQQLERFYATAASKADEKLIHELLAYFKSHEQRLADTYERVLDSEDKTVLNNWCRDYSSAQPQFIEDMNLDGLSMQQIVDKVVDAHQYLIDLYYELASKANTFGDLDLFNSLLELEENDLMQEKIGAQSFSELS